MTSPNFELDRNRIFNDLKELVAFDSVHGQPEAQDAAEWVAKALSEHGLDVEEHHTVDGSTTVIGTKPASEGAPTVLLYSHYDIVPAGAREDWLSDPFTLTERDGRWYGRGTADCKGNLVMHLAALRAVEQAAGEEGLKAGLTVLVEGSEEMGGEGLDNLIQTRPEMFQADAILIADSGNVAVGKPTLTTSLRGGAQLTVTVDTLDNPGHSGIFGGAAPDAVAALMRALDSLRDASGRTVIDGVDTSRRWEGEPYDAETFRADAGVLEGVELYTDTPADAVWAQPAVTVTGFTSTPVSEAVNAIPATASARINLRVPHGLDPHETAEKLAEHVKNHTPWGAHVQVTIDEVNPTFATDISGPLVTALGESLKQAYGAESLSIVGSGGSIPLTAALQKAVPDAEIVVYGVEEPQCTIHSPNESVDPTEIENIAKAEALFLLNL